MATQAYAADGSGPMKGNKLSDVTKAAKGAYVQDTDEEDDHDDAGRPFDTHCNCFKVWCIGDCVF